MRQENIRGAINNGMDIYMMPSAKCNKVFHSIIDNILVARSVFVMDYQTDMVITIRILASMSISIQYLLAISIKPMQIIIASLIFASVSFWLGMFYAKSQLSQLGGRMFCQLTTIIAKLAIPIGHDLRFTTKKACNDFRFLRFLPCFTPMLALEGRRATSPSHAHAFLRTVFAVEFAKAKFHWLTATSTLFDKAIPPAHITSSITLVYQEMV